MLNLKIKAIMETNYITVDAEWHRNSQSLSNTTEQFSLCYALILSNAPH